MPDYIYLLENRLSPAQRSALGIIREAARASNMTVFLAGGAVRDLTYGSPVRDLDVVVQGNALKLKRMLEKSGAEVWGEHEASRTLYLWLPGSVRVEVSSARREEFPKPGKPVYHWDTILEDLRRRDFTANAMALSLNENSYGLLQDPLNGVADIEARQLRLVSSYGFLEDPARMLRAVRLKARLGWELEERTQVRYENAKADDAMAALSPASRGYELEEIAHEEDALKALRALEAEGWMKQLCPAWTWQKADVNGIAELNRTLTKLEIQNVHPDPSTAHMQLLTAKLSPRDVAALKKALVRPGFVAHWERLEQDAKDLSKLLTGKEAATPSATWKLLTSYQPEAVLWLAYSSRSAAVQAKFQNFFSVWPEARQKMPVTLMLEMRITPDLPGYEQLLDAIFFELIDGRLQTEEEMRAFLEPHSPPAPPPPVSIRRSRGRKAEAKPRLEEEEDETEVPPRGGDEDDSLGAEDEDADEDVSLPPAPKAVRKTAPETKNEPKHGTRPEPKSEGKLQVSPEAASGPQSHTRQEIRAAASSPVKTAASAGSQGRSALKPKQKTVSSVAASAARQAAKPAQKSPAKQVSGTKKPAESARTAKPAAKRAAKTGKPAKAARKAVRPVRAQAAARPATPVRRRSNAKPAPRKPAKPAPRGKAKTSRPAAAKARKAPPKKKR